MMNEERRYYVYEWYIVETNEVFYIGKGTGRRCYSTNRNKMFKDFYSTHNCNVRKVRENLTEAEAFMLEHFLIVYYIEETDYRITNQNTGGSARTSYFQMTEDRRKMYEKMRGVSINVGKDNGMYGRNWTEFKTEEEIKEIGNKISNSLKGRKQSEETKRKQSIAAKKRCARGQTNFPDHSRPVMIIDKETMSIVAEYKSSREAIGNPYIKGHLNYKCLNKMNNPKDKCMIMYKSYKITERENFI